MALEYSEGGIGTASGWHWDGIGTASGMALGWHWADIGTASGWLWDGIGTVSGWLWGGTGARWRGGRGDTVAMVAGMAQSTAPVPR